MAVNSCHSIGVGRMHGHMRSPKETVLDLDSLGRLIQYHPQCFPVSASNPPVANHLFGLDLITYQQRGWLPVRLCAEQFASFCWRNLLNATDLISFLIALLHWRYHDLDRPICPRWPRFMWWIPIKMNSYSLQNWRKTWPIAWDPHRFMQYMSARHQRQCRGPEIPRWGSRLLRAA
jgi:hypothetical protein